MDGIIVLIIYAVLVYGVTAIFTKRTAAIDDRFHVSNRQMGTVMGAMSIAAAWIWAPALFVSAERAYLSGLPGLFWFITPNVLCLIFFIPFAKRVRAQMPEGITLSAYMGEKYQSRNVRGMYQFQLSTLAVFSTAVQLLAGGRILSLITGVPFWVLTVILAAIAFSYSQFSGIKAVCLTSIPQLVLMVGIAAAFAIIAAVRGGGQGLGDLFAGLSSVSGEYTALFNASGVELFLGFGLPTFIGLMSGPFGDQTFWQRAFTIKQAKIGKAFLLGALLFAILPLCMAAIGFMAAGSGFAPNDTGLVNFEYIMNLFPAWAIIPFLFMVITGLISTVDTNLCSAASLTTDYNERRKTSKPVMVILLLIAIGIANIPGLTVMHLFLLYGTQRASTLLPTVMTLLGKKLTGNGVFYGILTSLIIGLPIFAYGNIMNAAVFRTVGSLTTVLLSGIVALLIGRWEVKRNAR